MNISTYEVMDGLVRMFETINPDMPKETKSVIRKAVNDKKKDVENVEVDTLSNLQQTFFKESSSSSLDDSLKGLGYSCVTDMEGDMTLVDNGLFRHVESKDFCNTIFKGVDCGEYEGRFIDLAKQQSRG